MHAHDTPTAFDAALDAIVARMRPSGGGLAQAFTPFPIVVGARWMETPIRQGLAQRHGVAANLVFLLVDDAVDRLVAPRDGADAGWWEETNAGAAWCVAALRGKVVRALRAPGHAEVGALAASLEVTPTGALGWRALAFADQLATGLLAWMRARPEAPVAAGASSAAWFAPLAATLALDEAGSPRQLRAAALTGAAPKAAGPWGGPLVVGTTTLPAATRRLLERFGATFLPVLPDAPAEGLASRLRVRPCYGPLREVEALRDWLLELLAAGEGAHGVAGLTPRDVVVFTASPEVYGPLVESVFGRRAGAVERPSVKGGGVKGEGASVATTEEGDDVLPDTEDPEDTVEAESAREDAAEEAEEDEERAAEPDDPAARADGDGRGASVKAAAPPPRRAPPVIPVRVVELGLSRSNPLAAALLRVLGLAEDRVELPAFLSLMALRPVQRRFGLSPEDVSALTDMLVASGARWGLDAEDRGVADQPKLEQNTLRFGLERMALGRLLPAETLDVGADREPRVTMDLGSREQLARVGRLDRLLRALEEAMRDLRATQPGGLLPSGWRVRFGALISAFTDISAAGAWQRQRLDEVLEELLPAKDDAIGLLSASAVRRLLADGFALPQGASPPNEGAVTFAPLRPHGVPPARVVALLGMGLGAFPRTPVLPAWHPLADALPAEPGPREIAAAAFDAACAAATDRLWISWPGFEMQRGRELPPCAPVSRLLDEARLTDALEEAMKRAPAPLGRVERDAPVARVHRHPWEAATDTILDPDHADVHGVAAAKAAAEAAEAAAAKAKLESAGEPAAPPPPDPYRQPLPDPDRPTALTVDDLVRALLNPSEVFLRERLGIYLPDDDDPPPAREPLEVDTLDRYDVRTRLLKARGGGAADASAPDGAAADAAAAEVLLRLRGEGKLPVAAGAESYVGKQDALVSALLAAWDAKKPAGERLPVGLSATIDGVTLSTQVDRITRTEEGWTVELLGVSSPKGRRARLRTWVTTLLAARLGGEQPVRGTYWGLDTDGPDTFEVAPLTETDTAAALPGLLDVWRQARTRPIELFEETSAALATAEAETEDGSVGRTAEVRAAAHGFHAEPGESTFPDGMNRHVRALRPTYDAVGAVSEKAPELLDLSRKVWGGLAEQERARKAAKEAEKAAKAAVKKGGAK